MEPHSPSFFDQIGGLPKLREVHKLFYDKVYADPWLVLYFKTIKQSVIENQQTDFMADAMGGPQNYMGAFPVPAHKHMFITEELVAHRQQFLRAALSEARVPQELADKWLRIDAAFAKRLVKKSLSDCQKRYATDEIVDHPKPSQPS